MLGLMVLIDIIDFIAFDNDVILLLKDVKFLELNIINIIETLSGLLISLTSTSLGS